MIGIYKIENLLNGKVYIGQSINIEHRIYRHKKNYLNQNRVEFNKPLYRAFRKYGIDNFSFEVLQICNKETLNKLELYYISIYNSNDNKYGYNISLKESITTFVKLNNEVLEKIIKALKTTKPKKEIAEKFGISVQYLNLINKGKSLRLNNLVYPIRLKSDKELLKNNNNFCINCGKQTINYKFCSKDCSSKNQRKVINRPSKEELLFLLETMSYKKVGEIFNVSDNSIRKWLNK